jgi:hypothetical protein
MELMIHCYRDAEFLAELVSVQAKSEVTVKLWDAHFKDYHIMDVPADVDPYTVYRIFREHKVWVTFINIPANAPTEDGYKKESLTTWKEFPNEFVFPPVHLDVIEPKIRLHLQAQQEKETPVTN